MAKAVAFGRFLCLGLVLILFHPLNSHAQMEETFPVLTIGTQSYTNVTVTTKARKYIFILHSAGMANIPVAALSPELRQQLGYNNVADSDKPRNAASKASAWAKEKVGFLKLDQVKARGLQENWGHQSSAQIERVRAMDRKQLYLIAGVLLAAYVVYSWMLCLICQKTGRQPNFLIWFPFFRIFPMLHAANMSLIWFVAVLVPLGAVISFCVMQLSLLLVALAFIAALACQFVLWFNLAKARGKSGIVGLMVLLPVTNLFAFPYLAFSDGVPEKSDLRGSNIMTLELA